MENAAPRVGILMGSVNDWDVMQVAEKALTDLGIAADVRVISAHRTPDRLTRFLREAVEQVDHDVDPDPQQAHRHQRGAAVRSDHPAVLAFSSSMSPRLQKRR